MSAFFLASRVEINDSFGSFLDDGFDHPSETFRYVARQGNGSAFDVHAAIFLFEAPVGIDSPQKSVSGIGKPYPLVRLSRILDLTDTIGIGPAGPPAVANRSIVNIVIGVESHGRDFLFDEPQIDPDSSPFRLITLESMTSGLYIFLWFG